MKNEVGLIPSHSFLRGEFIMETQCRELAELFASWLEDGRISDLSFRRPEGEPFVIFEARRPATDSPEPRSRGSLERLEERLPPGTTGTIFPAQAERIKATAEHLAAMSRLQRAGALAPPLNEDREEDREEIREEPREGPSPEGEERAVEYFASQLRRNQFSDLRLMKGPCHSCNREREHAAFEAFSVPGEVWFSVPDQPPFSGIPAARGQSIIERARKRAAFLPEGESRA